MSPNKLSVRFGISEIKLLFIVLLGFCVVALVTKLVYISGISEEVPTLTDPTPKPGWNQEFERNIDKKWIIAVSKMKRKLSRPVKQEGYTVVYVAEQFNDNDLQMCRAPDCIYLDPREQRSMTFKVKNHLPMGASSRRVLGFLYAMSRGARVIYYKTMYPGSSSGSLLYKHSYTVMEYTLDPESVIELHQTNFNQSSCLSVPWLIYHKYILKREGGDIPTTPPKHKGEQREIYEHVSSKSGNGFTALDSSIESFQYKAFWALIFHTLYGGIGQALTRRLMHEIGNERTDVSENLFSEVQWNPEANVSREKEAKERRRLHAVLIHWECDPSLSFFSCIIDIAHTLSREKFISQKYFEIIKSWIMDLILIDSHQPVRRVHSRKSTERPPNSINEAEEITRPGHDTFSEECPGMVLSNNEPVIDDIALIIVFNEVSLYSNIPLLESMYRGYFKHIIYCGPYLNSFTRHSGEQEEIFHFIFIEALKLGWHLFYECLMLASQCIEVKGYIQIGDDTLLNPWNLKTLPRNKMWLHTGIDALNISLEEITPRWEWWQSRWGKPAVLNSLDFIVSEATFAGANALFTNFVKTYLANSEGLTVIYRHSCDFMYLPKIHVDTYLQIGSIFLKNEVMVEVAHGTIAMGIVPYNDIVFVKDGNLYTPGKKITFWMDYRRGNVFLHPFKLSYLKDLPNVRQVFCDKYMVDSEKNLIT